MDVQAQIATDFAINANEQAGGSTGSDKIPQPPSPKKSALKSGDLDTERQAVLDRVR